MSRKKMLSLLLCALLLTMPLSCTGATAAVYSDTAGHWASSVIEKWSAYGLILGYEGKFRPNDTITRAELSVILDRVRQYEGSGTFVVPDTSGDESYYSAAMARLCAMSIYREDGDILLSDEKMTREEVALMVARFFGVQSSSAALTYTDAATVSEDTTGYVSAMTQKGYMQGSNNLFRPTDPITRAELVQLLDNLISKTGWDAAGKLYYRNYSADIIDSLEMNRRLPCDFETDENGVITYTAEGATAIMGIDVATYQGEIDWAKVKAAGVEYAIIRVGFRGYTVGNIKLDDRFQQNIEGALANGIKVGVYFFSQAVNVEEALEEADFVLANIAGYDLSYPVYFDWERQTASGSRSASIDGQTITDCTVAFCERVKAAGYLPGVYANLILSLYSYDLTAIQDYDFWLARYESSPCYYYDFDMWQYGKGAAGVIDGIDAAVDLNISFKDYE